MTEKSVHFDKRLVGKSFRDCVAKVGYYGASFFMAEYMFGIVEHSPSTVDHVFRGSVQGCATRLWGNEYDGKMGTGDKRKIAALLKANGFSWRGTSQRDPQWVVPAELPFPWIGFDDDTDITKRKPEDLALPKEEPVSSKWMCTACFEKFNGREERDSHMATKHKTKASVIKSRAEHLASWREKHAGDEWTCPICSKTMTMQGKGGHIRSHRPTPKQQEILDLIKSEPGRRNDYYASILGTNRGSVSGLIRHLKDLGLVSTTGAKRGQRVWPGTKPPPGAENMNGKNKNGKKQVVVQERKTPPAAKVTKSKPSPNGSKDSESVYLLGEDGSLTLAHRVGDIEGTPIFKALTYSA